jgi:serine-type D-Ala-D-Ala carboxypeptidase/endopeptidase (penicillin-binding protein 4)
VTTFLTILFLCGASLGHAGESLDQKIDLILKEYDLGKTQISIAARHIPSGKKIYEKNANLALNPASTMKLLTAVSALETFSPGYRIPTELYTSPSQKVGELVDLWIKGYGNPFLVTEELVLIAQWLEAQGIKKINGPVYVDDTVFKTQRPLAFPAKHQSSKYRVITGALSFNYNQPEKISRLSPSFILKEWNYPHQEFPKKRSLWIHDELLDPAIYTGLAFVHFLSERGITVSGPVQFGKRDPKAELFLQHLSRSIGKTVSGMNKFSNNYIAEQVLALINVHSGGKAPTVMRTTLALSGTDMKGSQIINGSGLSRKNRLSAAQLTDLLRYALTQSYARDLVEGLSIAGVDGTLRDRFKGSPLKGQLWAKTGSLNGVRTLAGFLMTKKEAMAFTILINNFKTPPSKVEQAIEKITVELARASGSKSL